jgi:hypothetical protein
MTLITGTIIDSAGAPVPGAVLTLASPYRAAKSRPGGTQLPQPIVATADGAGQISLDLLPGRHVGEVASGLRRWPIEVVVPDAPSAALEDCVEAGGGELAPASVLAAQAARDAAEAARDAALAGGGLGIAVVSADPAPVTDGALWQRSDLGQLRGRVGGRTVILSEDQDEAITALVTTTSEGLAATADGQLFAVAAGGSIAIYRRFGGAAVLVRSASQEAPAPAVTPSAPALIASSQALGVQGLTLRAVIGRRYALSADAGALLTDRLGDLAAQGIKVRNDEAVEMSFASPFYVPDGLDIDWGPATAWKEYSGGPMVETRNYSAGAVFADVRWQGGTFRRRPGTGWGQMMRVIGKNCTFERVHVLDYAGGQGWLWGGVDFTLRDCVTITGQTDPAMTGGDGAYRCLRADRCLGIGLRGESRDDVFQFVPFENAAPTSPLYALSCEDSSYVGCTGVSHDARLIAVVAGDRDVDALPLPSRLRRLHFSGVSGRAEEGIIIAHMHSDGTPSLLDDVTLSGCRVVVPGEGSYGARILGTTGVVGAVGRVSLAQTSIIAPLRDTGIFIRADGGITSLDRCHITGDKLAVSIHGGQRTSIVGGSYESAAGGDPEQGAIYVHSTATGHDLQVSDGVLFPAVASGKAAISVKSGSATIDAARVQRAAAATGVVAIRPAAAGVSLTIRRAGVTGDFDTLYSTSFGDVRVIEPALPVRTGGLVSIMTGGLATLAFRDTNIIDTEGGAATDNLSGLSAPAGIQIGAIVPLRIASNDRTVTVLHSATGLAAGYYPIRTTSGTSLTLTSTGTTLYLMWMGSYWDDMSWAAIPAGAQSVMAPGVMSITSSVDNGYSASGLSRVVYLAGPFTRTVVTAINRSGFVKGDRIRFVRTDASAHQNLIKRAVVDGSGVIATLSKPGEWVDIIHDGSTDTTALKVEISGTIFGATQAGLVPPSGGGTAAFLRADGTWAAPAGGSSAWGGITGSLSAQTDLQAALDAKAASASLAAVATTGTFASLTDKPTDLSAYGIASGTEVSVTANTTVTLADYYKTFQVSATVTITLPTAPFAGFTVFISANSNQTATIALGGTDTIDGNSIVYPSEFVQLTYHSSGRWRRSMLRAAGVGSIGSVGLLAALGSTTQPEGPWRVTTATTGLSDLPSCLSGTELMCRIERTSNFRRSETVWNSAAPEQGAWVRHYAGSAWSGWTTLSPPALSTAQLPTVNISTGARAFDTTIGKTAVWSGVAWIAQSTFSGKFSDLSNIPTTLAGYGVADHIEAGLPTPSGLWGYLTSGRGPTTTRAEYAGMMRMRPYVARAEGTITAVAINVTTAVAGSLAKVALYASDPTTGQPAALIAETADMLCGAIGPVTAAIGPVPQVAGVQYWVAVRVSANQSLSSDPSGVRLNGMSTPSIATSVPTSISRVVSYASPAPEVWGWSGSELTSNRDPWMVVAQYA